MLSVIQIEQNTICLRFYIFCIFYIFTINMPSGLTFGRPTNSIDSIDLTRSIESIRSWRRKHAAPPSWRQSSALCLRRRAQRAEKAASGLNLFKERLYIFIHTYTYIYIYIFYKVYKIYKIYKYTNYIYKYTEFSEQEKSPPR